MILEYIIFAILALMLGQVVAHLNLKMPPVVAEEITYKEFFRTFKSNFKFDYKYSLILATFNFALLFFLPFTYLTCIYSILIAVLMVVFSIDYRFQLIPDEAHGIIAILGIINMIINIGNWYNYIIGAAIGGGIFYAISLLAVIIFKKEGMGFGDVKLMAALGFLFGIKNILVITLVAFFFGAIIGGALMIINKKKADSYIPFGPFIVLGTIMIMFVNPNTIIDMYFALCMSISNVFTDLIFKITN